MSGSENRISERMGEVVRGFMRLWAKFGAVLPQELESIRKDLEGVSPHGELLPDTNYELFFRLSSQLYTDESMTMREVSDAVAVPLSTATRIVDMLVERGYLRRVHDRRDRRVVRVSLSAAGKELHRTIEGHIIRRAQQLLSGLTEEEREEIFALIDKIESIINKVIK